jgi:hypothetical protein
MNSLPVFDTGSTTLGTMTTAPSTSSLWFTWLRVIAPAMHETAALVGSKLVTETITLQCLTPTQAGELILPYVRSSGSAYYLGKGGINVLTVRATEKELAEVKRLVGRFDNVGASACPVPLGAPLRPAPK